MTHEKQIEIRWRDVDAYQHVNNAVYATYLEECRDEWLEQALGEAGDPWDYVLARVAIDFRRELALDDGSVVVTCRLARIGTSSVRLREEIRTQRGDLAAESEAVVVARDRESGGSRPLTDAEHAAFERALSPAWISLQQSVAKCSESRAAAVAAAPIELATVCCKHRSSPACDAAAPGWRIAGDNPTSGGSP